MDKTMLMPKKFRARKKRLSVSLHSKSMDMPICSGKGKDRISKKTGKS
jgi:hypothetical protein